VDFVIVTSNMQLFYNSENFIRVFARGGKYEKIVVGFELGFLTNYFYHV